MTGLAKHLSEHAGTNDIPFPVIVLSEDGQVAWWNEQATQYLKIEKEPLIDSFFNEASPESLESASPPWKEIFEGDGQVKLGKMEVNLKDGLRLPVNAIAKSFEFEDAKYILTLFDAADTGQEGAASAELDQLRRGLTETFMLASFDDNFSVTYANPLFLSRSEWTPKRIVGKPLSQLVGSSEEALGQTEDIINSLNEGNVWSGEIQKVTKSGEPYWVDLVAIPMASPGTHSSFLFLEKDITEQREVQRYLKEIAYVDPITGLANRHSLEQTVNEAIGNGQHFSFVFIDIDRFYTLQDVSDSETEKILLKEFTIRLKTYFPDTIITRAGLHEFALITPLSSWFIEGFTDYLKQHPIYLGGTAVPLTVSGAITRCPEDQQTFAHLMKASVTTVKRIRERGGNALSGLSAEAHAELNRKALVEERLTSALDHSDFHVLYQPIVNLKTGKLERVEALVRWEDELAGTVMPDELIPIAEETGLIHEIGEFVLETVCRQLQSWNSHGIEINVSINTTIREFRDKNMVNTLMHHCEKAGCDPGALTFEINEKFAFEAEAEQDIIHQMKLLQQQGVRFALDDFGSGYASFRYLLMLPITSIKIDPTIIQPLARQEKMQRMVRGLIQFGKSLDFEVTAEGVETNDQLELLTAMECDTIQGYLTGRPMKAEELESWIK